MALTDHFYNGIKLTKGPRGGYFYVDSKGLKRYPPMGSNVFKDLPAKTRIRSKKGRIWAPKRRGAFYRSLQAQVDPTDGSNLNIT